MSRPSAVREGRCVEGGRAPVRAVPNAADADERIDTGDAADAPSVDGADDERRTALAWLILKLLGLYRATAVFRSPRCRFHPSCSTFAVRAVHQHGALRGSWLAIRRLGRCHPWNPGGVDHVPPRR